MADEIRTRPTSRVVLLDDDDKLLMLKIHDPPSARRMNLSGPDFWLLPGGGVKPGETYEQAARREILEETGIAAIRLGPCIWTSDYTTIWNDGELRHVVQRYFVARVPAARVPISFDGHEPLEALTTVGYEWFTRAEIHVRQSSESFRPSGLGGLLDDVLKRRPWNAPTEPLALSRSSRPAPSG